jgi:DNA-binding protein HU-beta
VPDHCDAASGTAGADGFIFVYSTRRENSKGDPMAKVMTKSQVIQAIADAHKQKLARKDVASVLETLATVGHKEMKKTGIFVLPGFAKFLVVLKARPVKAAKDAVA